MGEVFPKWDGIIYKKPDPNIINSNIAILFKRMFGKVGRIERLVVFGFDMTFPNGRPFTITSVGGEMMALSSSSTTNSASGSARLATTILHPLVML